MSDIQIRTALISVYDKSGLEPIIEALQQLGVEIFSTGGTYDFIAQQGVSVTKVEELTTYPSILDGRVKTLHPKVFGGILARRAEEHQVQLQQYSIPEIDLVIVDLYPFEETIAYTDNEHEIIEKIDIGGIALIRAAAKNFKDVVVVPSKRDYNWLRENLRANRGKVSLKERKQLAANAFAVSAHYDSVIRNYFLEEELESNSFIKSIQGRNDLRYGENPHQHGQFYGRFDDMFEKLNGKELSYNNLVDIDAAVGLIAEFENEAPTFAILKHTNSCGVATRPTVLDAWKSALEADHVSAFGGILVANTEIDLATASEINNIFYEVVIAPSYQSEAIDLLSAKKKRVVLRLKRFYRSDGMYKSILNGVLVQDSDLKSENREDIEVTTKCSPNDRQLEDLLFANRCVKHLKSNAIALVRDKQLLGMGCGQTSRVDALKQAITKAESFGFDLADAVMASDAFFPFSDCVEIAYAAGIRAVIQPGGSIRDQESIDFCNANQMTMVKTGIRHFRH